LEKKEFAVELKPIASPYIEGVSVLKTSSLCNNSDGKISSGI